MEPALSACLWAVFPAGALGIHSSNQRQDVRAFFLLPFLLVKTKSSLFFVDVFLLLFEHKAVGVFLRGPRLEGMMFPAKMESWAFRICGLSLVSPWDTASAHTPPGHLGATSQGHGTVCLGPRWRPPLGHCPLKGSRVRPGSGLGLKDEALRLAITLPITPFTELRELELDQSHLP